MDSKSGRALLHSSRAGASRLRQFLNQMPISDEIRSAFPASSLERAPAAVIQRLRSEWEWVPDEYFRFLSDVGWGSLGDHRFVFYSGPVPAGEIVDHTSTEVAA